MRPIRFLLSREGPVDPDTDWALAKTLRDAGFEVVLGGALGPEQTADTARDEGVDLVGYEIADDPSVVARLVARLREHGIGDLPVVIATRLEQTATAALGDLGVQEIFHPTQVTEDTLERFRSAGRLARSRPGPP